MEHSYDIIVIGGGIAGASIAAELSRSHRVAILEAESQPGFHSTGRSAAAFIPSYGAECDALRSLTLASYDFFATDAHGELSVPLLQRRGLVTIAHNWSESDAARDMASLNSLMPGCVSMISGNEVEAHLPRIRTEWAMAAWYEPDVYDIDVDATHQFFLSALKRRGGELLCGMPVSQLRYQDEMWVVEAANVTLRARTLVNAAGAWAEEIGSRAGAAPQGLCPMRRTALLLNLPDVGDPSDWPLVLDHGGSFYLKPDAGNLLVSLADETPSAPCDAQPEEIDIAYAVHNMQQAFDIDVQRVEHSWAGLRTFAPDRVPIFGYDQHVPHFFWAVGHGGHGIQIAPAAARLCAALIRREPIPEDILQLGFNLTDVQPSRFDSPSHSTDTTKKSTPESV